MIATNLAMVLISVTAVWLLSVLLRDASVVDLFWGTGFVILATICLAWSERPTTRSWILCAMVGLWGTKDRLL